MNRSGYPVQNLVVFFSLDIVRIISRLYQNVSLLAGVFNYLVTLTLSIDSMYGVSCLFESWGGLSLFLNSFQMLCFWLLFWDYYSVASWENMTYMLKGEY